MAKIQKNCKMVNIYKSFILLLYVLVCKTIFKNKKITIVLTAGWMNVDIFKKKHVYSSRNT